MKNVRNKFIFLMLFLIVGCSKDNLMIDLSKMSESQIQEYALNNNLNLNIKYEYSDLANGTVLTQNIKENEIINENDYLEVIISKGLNYIELYQKYNVNELGRIPIMMYHGIVNMLDDETSFLNGNVDKDGYHRTKESFIEDLEFYYNNDYRMIRLNDYVKGIIDVELGKSPIVLTFDDGLTNNIKVTGLDENGNIIIDPNCALGILESYKKKYPDFNVTATFFVNGSLFRQNDYNEKILNYLIDNGYDIGNHSYNHLDFTKTDSNETEEEIGKLYNLLDEYINDKYVNIVALPYGSPYKKSHENFPHILTSNYNNKTYTTIATLQVGWESDYSPFSKDFDKNFIKRIRAYDNNGTNFDIEYNFKKLINNRYISDGDKNKITVPTGTIVTNLFDLEVINY